MEVSRLVAVLVAKLQKLLGHVTEHSLELCHVERTVSILVDFAEEGSERFFGFGFVPMKSQPS